MACLFLSSMPFLDLIDSFIVLAAEVVAIIYLDEGAHSAFWFICMVPMMFSQLCSGEDGEGGGPKLSGIGMPSM
jgi:hypothetical protein